MHTTNIINHIKNLLDNLFQRNLKQESIDNPNLIKQVDEMFHIIEGLRETWVETKKFIECNRWNIVMIGNSLKNVHYVYLEDGELKSVGPILKINIKTHTIQLEGQEPFVLERLCPEHCVGLEIGKDKVAEHFSTNSSNLKFVAEKLMLIKGE
jgi:hypothetical protein